MGQDKRTPKDHKPTACEIAERIASNNLFVNVIVPLLSPLIAALALVFVITSEFDKIQTAQQYDRESRTQLAAAPAFYAETIWSGISYSATEYRRVESGWVLEYKGAANRLCTAIYSDPIVSKLLYDEMEFPNMNTNGFSNGLIFLGQLCVTSRELSDSGNLDEIAGEDQSRLDFILKTIRYFFEKDGCRREELYDELSELVRQRESTDESYRRRLISWESSAYPEPTPCKQTE